MAEAKTADLILQVTTTSSTFIICLQALGFFPFELEEPYFTLLIHLSEMRLKTSKSSSASLLYAARYHEYNLMFL